MPKTDHLKSKSRVAKHAKVYGHTVQAEESIRCVFVFKKQEGAMK